MKLPDILLEQLNTLEPGAKFTYSAPILNSCSGARYYAKAGSPGEREQYVGEAESLRHIECAAPGLAPRVVTMEPGSDCPYLATEYMDIVPHTHASLTRLAVRLAGELHQQTSTDAYADGSLSVGAGSDLPPVGCAFGFHVPTFCGATRLANGWYATWEECFDALIAGLQEGLQRRSVYATLCQKISTVRETVIPYLLRPLDVPPVLLHGDLWSGNTGVNSLTGEPVLYDPSSFYGHNEADLAIARMFGGFPRSFFEEYHKIQPKSEPVHQYDLRAELYELFHHLNHALLFGGGYASSASRKMDYLLNHCV